MKITRIGAAVFAGASIAALGLTASPAFADTARTLTPGSTLYAIDCGYLPHNLYSVNADTAAATRVGATPATNGPGCAGPSAWNPVTGLAYFISWSIGGNNLASLDVATGATTTIGGFTFDGNGVDPSALAIGLDGRAYIIAPSIDSNTSDSTLYSLDLTSGALTEIGDTGSFDESYYGFSVNPSTGIFYVLSTEGQLAGIDVTTGVQTPMGDPVELVYPGSTSADTEIDAMAIDRSGTIWLQNYGSRYSDLWSVDPADLTTPQLVGTIASDPSDVDGTEFDNESLFIVPGAAPVVTAPAVVTPEAVTPVAKPALAETGVSDAELTGMGFAAAASILLGAGTLLVPRMRRKARA